MAGTTLDAYRMISPDEKASHIASRWTEWNAFRSEWIENTKELRNYVFATDTSTTSGERLPWRNKTIVPKITQIYDNLKANYTATLFPNNHWMKWEADDKESDLKSKRDTIQYYMETKINQSGFVKTMDKIIDDYILYGNCFATVDYTSEVFKTGSREYATGYTGPKVVRISPYDIAFDPTAATWQETPKILRSVVSLGEAQRMLDDGDEKWKAVFDKMCVNRALVAEAGSINKSEGFVADGFSDLSNYYKSGYVEILTFYGDYFSITDRKLERNRKIMVVDRAYVICDEVYESWFGNDNIFHAGWRNRPDNLYAMGPLDNLVGLQYRINHLENLKSDVFDQIALPVLKVKGEVQDFNFQPGTKIQMGEDGDVAPLVPDATALQADFQIRELESKMEELAGAPKQAMGIRTPGEKTAFEVQSLENSASRIFQHKTQKFEMEFVEPILNAMLEISRRKMNTNDIIRTLAKDDSVRIFRSITRADLEGVGRIRPVGARHFAERNTRVQQLNQLVQLMSVPSIGSHLSGKTIAKILSEELNETSIFAPNIAITESMESQSMAQDAEAENADQLMAAQDNGL